MQRQGAEAISVTPLELVWHEYHEVQDLGCLCKVFGTETRNLLVCFLDSEPKAGNGVSVMSGTVHVFTERSVAI